MKLNIPYLKDDQIRIKVQQFLHTNKVNNIPVDIERIIEFNYNVDIIPIPGLQQNFDIDGFSTNDFESIYIDYFVYENRYARYRFTLAHEIAHRILHRSFFADVKISSMDDWKIFINDIDDNDHTKMEYQAYSFAGLVLVPEQLLKLEFDAYLDDLEVLVNQAKEYGLSKADYREYAIDKVANKLAPKFDVSVAVLTKRIKNDKLDMQIP